MSALELEARLEARLALRFDEACGDAEEMMKMMIGASVMIGPAVLIGQNVVMMRIGIGLVAAAQVGLVRIGIGGMVVAMMIGIVRGSSSSKTGRVAVSHRPVRMGRQ